MCLLKLKSTNPDFTYIICKNPESGMQLKSVRQGYAYGFYSDNPNTYIIYFRDGANEMSYKEYRDQNYEYLNKLRYMSPIFMLNAISEFLSSSTNSKHNKDIENTFSHKICMRSVYIDNRTFKTMSRFESFFLDFKISVVEKTPTLYKVTIETQKSLYLLLNFTIVYFGLISMLNNNDLDANDSLIERLIRSVNIVDAPYYMRYVICSRVLTNSQLYKKFIPSLQKSNMILKYGNTALHRRNHIRGLIELDRNICDIGCGSGFYLVHYSEKLFEKNKELKYYGIDIDENELAIVRKKVIDNNLTNVVILNSHEKLKDHVKQDVSYDVIITEVIEHMDKAVSQGIIRWVLSNVNFNKIIITTPNFDFNINYHLKEFRHDDHKWELTGEQFKEYVNDTLGELSAQLKITYLDIGDQVDGIACSQGLLIQKID